jgi:hypothetical protein
MSVKPSDFRGQSRNKGRNIFVGGRNKPTELRTDKPLCFSAARGGALVTNYRHGSRAAEKQKEKECVGVAFYKQATTT